MRIMSNQIFSKLLVAALAVVIAGAILFYLVSSLWFMRAVLPSNDYQLIMGYVRRPGLERIIAPSEQKLLSAAEVNLLPQFSSYVIAKSAGATYVVGLPQWRYQINIVKSIPANGWQVGRFFPLVWVQSAPRVQSAQEGQASIAEQSLVDVIKNYWRNLATHNWLFRPLAIVEIKPSYLSLLDDYYQLQAYPAGKNTINIAIKRGRKNADDRSATRSEEPAETTMSQLAVRGAPSSVIDRLPANILNAWEEKISQSFNIGGGSMSFASLLREQEGFGLSVEQGGMAVSITGEPERFKSALAAQIKEEVSFNNPVRKAFRLPDGTLGYEYVPGDGNAIWREEGGGCYSNNDLGSSLWLCQANNQAALAQDHQAAVAMLNMQPPPGWQIVINSPFTDQLQFAMLEQVIIDGGGDTARVKAIFSGATK